MTDATENVQLAKPKVIENLVVVGNAVLWLSAISGVLVLYLYAVHRYV
jgi:hypothetical protein